MIGEKVHTIRPETKKYGKVGEKRIANDGEGFMIGLIIGKYCEKMVPGFAT